MEAELVRTAKNMQLNPQIQLLTESWIDRMDDETRKTSGVTEPGWYFWDETGGYAYGPYDSPEEAQRQMDRYGQELEMGGLNLLATELKERGIKVRHINIHDDEIVLNNRFSVRLGDPVGSNGPFILSTKYYLGNIKPTIWDHPMRNIEHIAQHLIRKGSKVAPRS